MSPSRVVSASLFLGLLLVTSAAAADLPPPNGQKFVPFYAQVSGLAADRVLLVYPWSLSNGAPTEEIGVLAEGSKLGFGRRIMGEPKLYAMKKADWEARKAQITELPTEGAIDCGTTVSPTFLVSSDGPDEMVVSYRVAEISDGACRLEVASGASETSGASEASGSGEPADAPNAGAPAPDAPLDGAPATSDTPAGGGCASCGVGVRGASTAPWWLLGLAALAWRRSR